MLVKLKELLCKRKTMRPDVSILVDYFKESGHIIFSAYPETLDNAQIVAYLDLAVALVAEQCPEITSMEDMQDIEDQILSPRFPPLKRIK